MTLKIDGLKVKRNSHMALNLAFFFQKYESTKISIVRKYVTLQYSNKISVLKAHSHHHHSLSNSLLFLRQRWKNWQLDQTKKHSTALPGFEPGSPELWSDALTTELRSHDRNCVRILAFHQAVSSFSTMRWPGLPEYTSTRPTKTRWI